MKNNKENLWPVKEGKIWRVRNNYDIDTTLEGYKHNLKSSQPTV